MVDNRSRIYVTQAAARSVRATLKKKKKPLRTSGVLLAQTSAGIRAIDSCLRALLCLTADGCGRCESTGRWAQIIRCSTCDVCLPTRLVALVNGGLKTLVT